MKRAATALLVTVTLFSWGASIASALTTNVLNIRGLVANLVTNGSSQIPVGRSGISVVLVSYQPNHLQQVGSVLTDSHGIYYFYDVSPGKYMLVIANHYYRIVVVGKSVPRQDDAIPTEDIAPINIP